MVVEYHTDTKEGKSFVESACEDEEPMKIGNPQGYFGCLTKLYQLEKLHSVK
jgi:hypothetical protein